MLTQTPALPPALQRIAATPILASETPKGFPHVKVVRLPAQPRIQTLGGIRIDFSNSRATESESFALTRTPAAAKRLAHTEASFKRPGFLYTRAVATGRFAVAVIALTKTDANALLALALAHLRRSEG